MQCNLSWVKPRQSPEPLPIPPCKHVSVCLCLKQNLFLGNRNFPPLFIVIGSYNDVRLCKGVALKSLCRATDMKSHDIIGSPVHSHCFKIVQILKGKLEIIFSFLVWPLSLYRCTRSPLASFFHEFMRTKHRGFFSLFFRYKSCSWHYLLILTNRSSRRTLNTTRISIKS